MALERVAHALPYLLFAAALLLLDSIGRGATQEEFFKSLQNSVNSGPETGGLSGRGLAIFFGPIAVVVLLAILNRKLKARAAAAAVKTSPRPLSKPAAINQPRKLLKEVGKAAGLSRDEMRQLKAVAEQHRYGSPLTLLLCPSLLIEAARKDDTNADKAVLARVARKVAAA